MEYLIEAIDGSIFALVIVVLVLLSLIVGTAWIVIWAIGRAVDCAFDVEALDQWR